MPAGPSDASCAWTFCAVRMLIDCAAKPMLRKVSGLASLAYPGAGAPPLFIAHGDRGSLIPVETARLFAERMRAGSAGPVIYAELPGAPSFRDPDGMIVQVNTVS